MSKNELNPAKRYDLGYGHMGNGLTVWNRLEEKDGDYITIAHIASDRSVTFFDQDMPENVKKRIEQVARTSELTVSTAQDTPVFAASNDRPVAFIDSYSIYQLKDSSELRDYRFETLNGLDVQGLTVERGHYELAYRAQLTAGETLERIYQRFNTNHPPDFKGHSLSMSDVIVLRKNGLETTYYVDRFSFEETPEFLAHEKPEKLAATEVERRGSEQPDNAKSSADRGKSIKTSIYAQLKMGKAAAALAQKEKKNIPKHENDRGL